MHDTNDYSSSERLVYAVDVENSRYVSSTVKWTRRSFEINSAELA